MGRKNVNADDKVNEIFDKFSSDEKKRKLTKKECFQFWTRRDSTISKEQVEQVVHYPDRFHDGVTIPIKKVNNNNNNSNNNSNGSQTIYYSDFCTSRMFWQIDGMYNVKMRVRGKYIDGKPFEFVQLSKEEEYQRGYLAPQVGQQLQLQPQQQQPNPIVTTPPTQTTAHETREPRQQRQRRKQRKQQRKGSHQAQRGKQSSKILNTPLIKLGNKKGKTRKIVTLEKQVKDWLKTGKTNRIQKNLSNGNVSSYGNGKRRAIKSQIHDDNVDTMCLSIKFCISTIKNGVVSHNVNEISLDCEIVRVSVILTSQVSYELGLDRIYFDGESGESEEKSLVKCYNWTKNQNNKNKKNKNGDMVSCQSVTVHGPIYGKDSGCNVVYYSDFSLQLLYKRFGNGLKNGIMPRARGYTIDANEYKLYFCGGYDYLIYGKSHTHQAAQGNNDKQLKHQMVHSTPAPAPAPQRASKPLRPPQTEQMLNIKNPTLQKEKLEEYHPRQVEKEKEMVKHVEYSEKTDECTQALHVNHINLQMGTYCQWQVVHSTMSQVNVSQQQMGNYNYWNQAQFGPVCTPNGQNNFINNQGNGVIVGYLVPIEMSQMQQVEQIQETRQVQVQVQQFEEMEQRVPMPRAMPHGMYNGAIPRRPPMKNMFSNDNNNNSWNKSKVNLDCDSNVNFDEDWNSSVANVFTSMGDNTSIITTSDETSYWCDGHEK